MKATILDAASLGPDLDLSPLLSLPLSWEVWDSTPPALRQERCAGAAIILSNKVQIDAALMAAVPQLRLISVLATGTNNVDLVQAAAAGIAVSNVRDYASEAVVQHTLCLMLALAGNLLSYSADVQQNRWHTSPFFCYFNRPINSLSGRNLGIVGYGSQGRRLATIARAMGMNVLLAARSGQQSGDGERLALDELLPRCDVLSFHCPLTPETQSLLHRGNIYHLKKNALVINCARGGIVDETALMEALASGHLGGAALDVLSQEPPAADHPLVHFKHPNFILTPHIAWASLDARQRLLAETVENIKAFLQGQTRNAVTASH